jgi:hypothetical protein
MLGKNSLEIYGEGCQKKVPIYRFKIRLIEY